MNTLRTREQLLRIIRGRVAASQQTTVAGELGISKQQLNDILNGRSGISDRIAQRMGFQREIVFRKVA